MWCGGFRVSAICKNIQFFSGFDIVSLLKLRYSPLFWESGIITPEKELKVSVAGVTQPLLLAKEEDVATKRSKPTEDNKFCHEQVNVLFALRSINLFYLLIFYLFLIVAPGSFRVASGSHAVEMYVDMAIGNVMNPRDYFGCSAVIRIH